MRFFYTDTEIPSTGINAEFVRNFATPISPILGSTNLPFQLEGQVWSGAIHHGMTIIAPDLNPTLPGEFLIYKDSSIGFGISNITPIKAGDIVCFFPGELTTRAELKKTAKTITAIEYPDDKMLTADKFGHIANLINHAPPNLNDYSIDSEIDPKEILTANVRAMDPGKATALPIVALKDIPAFSVLVMDYGLQHFMARNITPKLFFNSGSPVPTDKYRLKQIYIVFQHKNWDLMRSRTITIDLFHDVFEEWMAGRKTLNGSTSGVLLGETRGTLIIHKPSTTPEELEFGPFALDVTKLKAALTDRDTFGHHILVNNFLDEDVTEISKTGSNYSIQRKSLLESEPCPPRGFVSDSSAAANLPHNSPPRQLESNMWNGLFDQRKSNIPTLRKKAMRLNAEALNTLTTKNPNYAAYTAAKVKFQKSLALFEKIQQQEVVSQETESSKTALDICKICFLIGRCAMKTNDPQDAFTKFKRSYEIRCRLRQFGPEHLSTQKALGWMNKAQTLLHSGLTYDL